MITSKWTRRNTPGNTLYLSNEEGDDWYVFQKEFSENTFKVAFTESYVSHIEKDVSLMFPDDCRVAEVTSIPEDFSNSLYTFDGFSFSPKQDSPSVVIAKNKRVQDRLINQASYEVSPLVVLEQMGVIGDRQLVLNDWRTYLTALMKVDLSNPTWPTIPGVTNE